MKKLLLLACLPFFGLIYWACKRNNSSAKNDPGLAAAAKAYLAAQKAIGSNNAGFIDTLITTASWSQLSTKSINAFEFIAYVPVTYNSNKTGLVYVFNKKNSSIEQSYLLEVSGAVTDPAALVAEFYSYGMGSFTGTLDAYNYGKAMTWELGYQNGSRMYRKAIKTGNQSGTLARGSGKVTVTDSRGNHTIVTGGSCLDYYLVTYYDDGSEDWEYIGTGCTQDCTVIRQILQGNVGAKTTLDAVTTTCGGGGSGGGGGSSTVAEDSVITQNLTNPCFVAVLNTLMHSGMSSDLTNIIQNTFNSNDRVNLTYFEQPVAANDPAASAATTGSKSGDEVYIQTTLAENQLNGAAKEYVAETMFHEAIHGILDADGSIRGELNQHLSMITSWVGCELAAMQEMFPNLTTHNGLCLILSGLSAVNEIQPATYNAVIASYGLTINQISMTADMYKGGLGTPCPTGSNNGSGGGGHTT
jgi:hypothetical protein